jgi:predicted nucleic acid-binding protein
MNGLLDSSILVAALIPDEPHHAESKARLLSGTSVIHAHALLETFSTLTGGRLGVRVDADLAARLLRESIRPRVRIIMLSEEELFESLDDARRHGARGGAVYDYMHLVAARKAAAECIFTLNLSDFTHLVREGDPPVRLP